MFVYFMVELKDAANFNTARLLARLPVHRLALHVMRFSESHGKKMMPNLTARDSHRTC